MNFSFLASAAGPSPKVGGFGAYEIVRHLKWNHEISLFPLDVHDSILVEVFPHSSQMLNFTAKNESWRLFQTKLPNHVELLKGMGGKSQEMNCMFTKYGEFFLSNCAELVPATPRFNGWLVGGMKDLVADISFLLKVAGGALICTSEAHKVYYLYASDALAIIYALAGADLLEPTRTNRHFLLDVFLRVAVTHPDVFETLSDVITEEYSERIINAAITALEPGKESNAAG